MENIALYAFQKYGDTALRAAYCACGSREDAEDIAQEIFLELHANPRSFSGDEHLKAWILRAVINRCKNLRKSVWRRMRVEFEDITEPAAKEDNTREILAAIRRLPKDKAEVVYLHDYEGYTVKEIADMLEKNENTVSSLLRRGRAKLRLDIGTGDAE